MRNDKILLFLVLAVFSSRIFVTSHSIRGRANVVNSHQQQVLDSETLDDKETASPEDSEDGEDNFEELAMRVARRVLVTKADMKTMPQVSRAQLNVEDTTSKIPMDDPLAVFDQIRKRMGPLGSLNGKPASFGKHDLSAAASWGADLARGDEEMSAVGEGLREAFRASTDDQIMEVAELEAQLASTKLQLEDKLSKQQDPAPEIPFPGGLAVFFKGGENTTTGEDANQTSARTWGEGDKHVIGMAIKQKYEHGPLVCLCTLPGSGGTGSLLGPVLATANCHCLNQPISNVLPELSEGSLEVEKEQEDASEEEDASSAEEEDTSEEEDASSAEEEELGESTVASRRLKALIEGSLKPGGTYNPLAGPSAGDDDDMFKYGNPPPWLVEDLVAWGSSMKVKMEKKSADDDGDTESATGGGATGTSEDVPEPLERCGISGANDGVTETTEECLCGKDEAVCPKSFFCCAKAGECPVPSRFGECSSKKFEAEELTNITNPEPEPEPEPELATPELATPEDPSAAKRHQVLAEWMKTNSDANKEHVGEILRAAKAVAHLSRDEGDDEAGDSDPLGTRDILAKRLSHIDRAVNEVRAATPGEIVKKLKNHVKSYTSLGGAANSKVDEMVAAATAADLERSELKGNLTSLEASVEYVNRFAKGNDTETEGGVEDMASVVGNANLEKKTLDSLQDKNARLAAQIAVLAAKARHEMESNMTDTSKAYLERIAQWKIDASGSAPPPASSEAGTETP